VSEDIAHEFVAGSYLPPELYAPPVPTPAPPPQTIISEPVHTAVWKFLALGTFCPGSVAAHVSFVHPPNGSAGS